MKKNLVLLTLPVLMLAIACRKNTTEKLAEGVAPSIDARITNNHVVFKTVEDYSNFLALDERQSYLQALPGSETFSSYKTKKNKTVNTDRDMYGCEVPDSLIEASPDFFAMIDQDGVIEIEGNYYRYDYCDGGVWVVSSADFPTHSSSFYDGTEVPGIVGFFPDYVDVLEAVAEGYRTMPDSTVAAGREIFEKSGLLGSRKLENFDVTYYLVKVPVKARFDGKLSYDKYGFYFHFYGKEKYKKPCFNNWCTTSEGPRDWTVYFQYMYRRKGRDWDVTGSATISPEGRGENKVDKTFYDGNRGLKYGGAIWDVQNVFAKDVRIERNGGSIWYDVTSYILFAPRRVTNYETPQGPNHFSLGF